MKGRADTIHGHIESGVKTSYDLALLSLEKEETEKTALKHIRDQFTSVAAKNVHLCFNLVLKKCHVLLIKDFNANF